MAYVPVIRLYLDFFSRIDREAFTASAAAYLQARLAGLPVDLRALVLARLPVQAVA